MNVQKIKDFHDPALDLYARTKEAQLKHRPFFEQGLFIAESPIVIERAIAAGYEPVSFLMEEDGKEVEQKLASRFTDVPVYTAPFDVLTKITGFSLTRGMLSAMVRKELPSVDACSSIGGCGQSDQCGRDLPLGSGTWHGCGTAYKGLCRSALSTFDPCQYGNGISDPVDVSSKAKGRGAESFAFERAGI